MPFCLNCAITPNCQGFVQYGVFNNGNTTTSLDNLFQCLTILMMKNYFSWYLVGIYHGPLLAPVASYPITMQL